MSQQFRRDFKALSESVPAPLLHRLMFLFFLRKSGRLAADTSLAEGLRRFPFGERLPDPPPETIAKVAEIFDGYDWHLNEGASGEALTPRVLADTFEQSVNRRQTGTYYTGQDVTNYIVRATVLPRLLDDAAAACPKALGPDGAAWRLLRDRPDVRSMIGLPRAGVVRTPDDLITANCDLLGWLHILIAARPGSTRLTRVLYESLGRLTLLDPTCGCGDFLLAALKLLTWLHLNCLVRMRRRVDDEAIAASILRHNLRGVDLMPEAVEVCRLRLWLRWALDSGTVDLKRVPDLTRTIRAGDAVAGLDWRAAFPEVLRGGGFGVVVGNPPYVETAATDQSAGYRTASCGNLYAPVVECALGLLAPDGRLGMIVPHSAICTDRMAPLLSLVTEGATTWVSTYDIRPSKLFAGVDQRLAIVLRHASPRPRTYSTRYHRWQESERPHLFQGLRYLDVSELRYEHSIPKAGDPIEAGIWHKIHRQTPLCESLRGNAVVYYHNAPRYWVRAMTFAPYFWNERDGEKLSAQVKTLPVRNDADAAAVAALLNSSLFCWWWLLLSDCRHLNRREIDRFPAGIAEMTRDRKRALGGLCRRLMADYRHHAERKVCRYRTTGKVVYDEFYPGRSKAILDDIDRALAGHYGLTEKETDFLIHYDIKYRLGRE